MAKTTSVIEDVLAEAAKSLRPPPRLTVAAWAERLAEDERPSATAIDLMVKLIVGQIDAPVAAWLRAGALRWVRAEAESLTQALHVGDSARRVRLAIRDRWLADACEYVDGSPWAKARVLQREGDHLVRYRWPSWRKLDAPPLDRGTAIELCLHGAMLAEPRLPTTVEGWYTVTKHVAGTP